jgi:hypothetical protein
MNRGEGQSRVAASEAEMLMLARSMLGAGAPDEVRSLLQQQRAMPAVIGPTALALLREALSKGTIAMLGRAGGWRTDISLATDPPRRGRLWQRHSPPLLRFGTATWHVLRWLCSEPMHQPPPLPPGRRSAADELCWYRAAVLLDASGYRDAVAALAGSPLCRLAFPDLMYPSDELPDLSVLCDGAAAVVMEALQGELAERWLAMERHKSRISAAAELERIGLSQEQVLTGFLDAIDRAGRRDLGSFLVDAAHALLRARPAARLWIRSLAPGSSLEDRQAAARAAGSFLRAVCRIHGWWQELGTVAFFDEGYEAAQALLARWQLLGRDGFDHAARLVRELDSLRVLEPSPAEPEPRPMAEGAIS